MLFRTLKLFCKTLQYIVLHRKEVDKNFVRFTGLQMPVKQVYKDALLNKKCFQKMFPKLT